MPINSPVPVRLEEECHKAAKTLRKFVDSRNNGLDKVIPQTVLERAAGFAIYTVIKAGFIFSARAGSGIVIARLDDGSWSAPSAIGTAGVGFGGQAGAEVTDFLIVLNSRSAVKSFMSAGSLTLGGNLSVAVGPLGRNAEGSGTLNTKGKVAAMYSYSKTKGLFGGVSVEGSVIVERQDANRLAYGGSPTVKQILSGAVTPPEWAYVIIDEVERCTASKHGKWRTWEEEENGEWGSPQGGRSRSGSNNDYMFADGAAAQGNSATGNAANGRKRAGSLFSSKEDRTAQIPDTGRASPRPSLTKRTSSFNPFSGSGNQKRNTILSSSESYNAGLTWDSDGPVKPYGRSRSGSAARSPGAADLLGDWGEPKPGEPIWKGQKGDNDLLGTWESNDNGLSAHFDRLSTGPTGNASPAKGRSRSGTTSSRQFDDIREDEYVAYESESRMAKMSFSEKAKYLSNSAWGGTLYGNSGRTRSSSQAQSPFGEDVPERQPFDDYHPPPPAPKPNLQVREGLDREDGYPRAMALYAFNATAAGDLGMAKGDVVTVLDKVGNGDWWSGRNSSGKEGIFPSNYVEVVGLPKDLRGGLTRTELKARMSDLGFD